MKNAYNIAIYSTILTKFETIWRKVSRTYSTRAANIYHVQLFICLIITIRQQSCVFTHVLQEQVADMDTLRKATKCTLSSELSGKVDPKIVTQKGENTKAKPFYTSYKQQGVLMRMDQLPTSSFAVKSVVFLTMYTQGQPLIVTTNGEGALE